MNMSELLFILVLLMVVVGPQRLPEYAESLARWVRQLRRMAMGARDQVRAELGPEFDDVDWTKLDPRQYDPRRIVREALTDVWDDEPTKPVSSRPRRDAGQEMASTDASAPRAATARGVAAVDPELVSSQPAAGSAPTMHMTDDSRTGSSTATPVESPRSVPPQEPAEQVPPGVPFDVDAT